VRVIAGLFCLGLVLLAGAAAAADANVTYTITNGGVPINGSQAAGQFHLYPPGHHDRDSVGWGNSGDHATVPAGAYDVQITFSDGAAHKEIWLDNQNIDGTVARNVEIGIPIGEASYKITNGGVDAIGTQASAQFHLYPPGHHDGDSVAWGNSDDHVRVPAGNYDVQINFSDGSVQKEIWLDNQAIAGTVAKTVEIGAPLADVSYKVTNGGADTNGTQASAQFHLYPPGHHDGASVAWGNSDDHVHVAAGTYDVQINFANGAAKREIWIDNQSFAGTVARTVEAGVATADVSYTITNGGVDTKGTEAAGQFHLYPPAHHDGDSVSWGNSGDHTTVPAGAYDVRIDFGEGLVKKQIWIDNQNFTGTVARTVELGIVFAKPIVVVTRDRADLADEATVTYFPPGNDNAIGSVRSRAEALLEPGSYDIYASFEDAEGWLRNVALSGAPHLVIAVVRPKVQTLTAGAPPPKACTIEVYGVNFDFDKATLRPESEPVLREVLALFTTIPGFATEVAGHTDNVGTAAYNMRLSEARAAAVRNWLIQHAVAASRVSSRGYGDTQPLVPNTSDENRFKNRRVELRRTKCK
jgi:outer membrane protein OmpA-like peptidoglycan-associated protein